MVSSHTVMRLRTSLVAVAAAALYAAPASADTIATDKTVELESNTNREIAVPIPGLGQAQNVLEPCFGFEITGPGVDLAGANLETFGTTVSRGREPARRRHPGRAAPGRRQLQRSPSRPPC